MKVKVYIIVLNYNTFEKSKVCIDSCLKQTGIEYKILLLDNHSTDDSLGKLRTIYGDQIDYFVNEDNYGFAKGNNIGVKYSRDQGAKYSFLLNSDTELIGNNLLCDLVSILESHVDCAVVAPTIYDVTKKGLYLHPNDSFYLKMLRVGNVIPQNVVVSENLELISEAHGSALIVDNDSFINVGGFPEHYFMYGEEGCFAKRILWSGKKIYWFKDYNQYILHHHDKTGNVAPWRLFLMGRNRGLEYWENRKGHRLWPLIYCIFYLCLLFQNKTNNYYLKGLSKAKELHNKKSTCFDIYNQAVEIKRNYVK